MCDRCLELEEEITQLKQALGFKYDGEQPEFGLTAGEWRIFRTLQEYPQGVSKHRLHPIAIDAPKSEAADYDAVLKVLVCRMRKKLVDYGYEIQPIRGFGYVMTFREEGIPGPKRLAPESRNEEAA